MSDVKKIPPAIALSRIAIVGPIAANIAFVMELTLVPLLLPAIQAEFDLSIGTLAWVFNLYGIAVAIGVLLGGLCGDAFNTRKVFGCGLAFFAAGSLLVALSGSFQSLIIGRSLQGLGSGIFSPLIPLLLTRLSPEKPGRVLIFWGSFVGYIAAFAPLLYSNLLETRDWHVAFFLLAIIAMVALAVLGASQEIPENTPSRKIAADYSTLFRAKDLWLTFVYVFCTYGSITYYLFRLPTWVSSNDVKVANVGFALTVLWLTFSVLSALLRNLVDSPRVRVIMLAAPFLIFAGVLLSFQIESPLFLIFSSVLVGSGLACSNSPSTQLILRFAPHGMSAISTSLDITFARLGGIALVAVLAETGGAASISLVFVSCCIAALCALTAGKKLEGNG